ncbi:lysine N(6)-hydroxylase/L-ornithine N(5)-oxygenase family protein [Priestia megaterium]|uniref:L-lysine N6-monooxygenase MbtG n=1 Tax=Priestia megaterium (strain DSM 319 / IMG 1521) TaxID=592022 RepID=D5DJI9_PRIM3|nr:lysine N(6)-hydroxylase/L-ornithine N(5)-oxygenase family protein [Priestia megaterium]ADF40881.1 putative L-lysine 6-monooxygenase (NADPH) [Priestia megaterium DSM 319]MED3943124.1 lysine N(6)-hydroxylase/L-ornithine N(5)-oxygenase family protein [Priestia megaterium]MED4219411.1 lysine N(6)-hydroxylase/L-ornithine N(5)-oxygenase family protein [Priestia megaterium]WEZ39958.1 lysine N(6)-hydroxylase/L-ornithine N(5)-oxygenase family protein [Priestia megaterium DSM 319]
MEQRDILDVIGVGVGPFNLGLAALIDKTDCTYKCFEQKKEFNWHPGMLLEGTTLQVPFMADVVTMVDPKSPYTFLNYLHEHERLYQFYFFEKFHIPRNEYNHYCRWVASQLSGLEFNSTVKEVKMHEDAKPFYEVTVEKEGKLHTYYSYHLVTGVGTQPVVPRDFQSVASDTFYHSAQYKMNREQTLKAKSITVIGSGQSAAEIVYDLLQQQPQFDYKLNWYTRSKGFYPMEYSKLGLEHFSPDYTRYFYRLPQEKKESVLRNQALLYKGISFETIGDIYDLIYERTIGGKEVPLTMRALTELAGVEKTNDTHLLTLHQYEQDSFEKEESEIVIMATGYHAKEPSFMEGLKEHLLFDEKGQLKINELYQVEMKKKGAQLFVQNGELHTHGVGAPDLGLGAYRNAVLINQIAGKNVYKIYKNTVFQKFGF